MDPNLQFDFHSNQMHLKKSYKLFAHKKHNFQNKKMKNKKVNYIRINIFPDGGISRIRAFGEPK